MVTFLDASFFYPGHTRYHQAIHWGNLKKLRVNNMFRIPHNPCCFM